MYSAHFKSDLLRSAPRAALGALLLAAPAAAQGFNVDFDDSFTGTALPSNTYAAAGTVGTWNSVMNGATSLPLVDKTGASTGATITLDPTYTSSLTFDNVNLSGEDALLMEDIIYGGTSGGGFYPITFDGLADG